MWQTASGIPPREEPLQEPLPYEEWSHEDRMAAQATHEENLYGHEEHLYDPRLWPDEWPQEAPLHQYDEWPQEEVDAANAASHEHLYGPEEIHYVLEDPRADLPPRQPINKKKAVVPNDPPSDDSQEVIAKAYEHLNRIEERADLPRNPRRVLQGNLPVPVRVEVIREPIWKQKGYGARGSADPAPAPPVPDNTVPNATGEPIYGDRKTAARMTGRSKWEFTRIGARKKSLDYLAEKRGEINRQASDTDAASDDGRTPARGSADPAPAPPASDQKRYWRKVGRVVAPNAHDVPCQAYHGCDASRATANARRKRIISRAMRSEDQVPLPDSGDERMFQFYRSVHLECLRKKKAKAKAKALAVLEVPGVHWPRCEICKKKNRWKHSAMCPGCQRWICLRRCMLESRRHRMRLCIDCAGNESFDSWSQSSDSTGSDVDAIAARLIPNCYAWRVGQALQEPPPNPNELSFGDVSRVMAVYIQYVVLLCISYVVGGSAVVADAVCQRYRTTSSRVALLRRILWFLLCVALVCWVSRCTVGRAMAAPSRFEASVPPGHGNPAMPNNQYRTNLPKARQYDSTLPTGWDKGFCTVTEVWFYIYHGNRSTTWMHPKMMQQFGAQ
ncbi:MAG: hypothetical protein NZ847_08950, partial [Acidobacteria bacterium]|nr:hypothetical protein [Acidobacteriota bacterium]